jgi:serine/threonine protein kinase
MSRDDQQLYSQLPESIRDRFEMLAFIGVGGTGTVIRAWDRVLKRSLAVKLLNPEKTSVRNLLRFQKEAKTISRLKHPGIVEIYDFIFTDMNQPVLIMEIVEGESLDRIIARRGAFDLPEALNIFEQLTAAIGYAHSQGVLHRDLACTNVLAISCDPAQPLHLKVVDFGVSTSNKLDDRTISVTGQLVGTATVVSPEQARGQPTDFRSDIYSLGCLMFKVLTGVYPLVGASFGETAQMQIGSIAPPLHEKNSGRDYPEELERIIAKTMKKNPADRYQTVEELQADLTSLAEEIESYETSQDTLPELFEPTPRNVELALERVNRSVGGDRLRLRFSFILIICSIGILTLATSIANQQGNLFDPGRLNFPRIPLSIHNPVEVKNSALAIIRKNDTDWIEAKGSFSDSDLDEIRKRREIRRVSLRGCQFTDAILRQLCRLRLIVLDLRDTKITDKSLEIVSHCSSLRSLLLSGCKVITDNGCRNLSRLDNLIVLDISRTNLTDPSVQLVCRNDLRTLGVSDCRITDDSLPSILSLPNLDTLYISRTRISKAGIIRLFRKDRLGSLAVAGYDLTETDLPFDGNRNFSRLDLRDNNWSDRIFSFVTGFPHIAFLRFEGCNGISDGALNMYSKNHPDIIVMPGNPFHCDDVDTEGYFEPRLFDITNGNQERIINQLAGWDADEHFEKGDESTGF